MSELKRFVMYQAIATGVVLVAIIVSYCLCRNSAIAYFAGFLGATIGCMIVFADAKAYGVFTTIATSVAAIGLGASHDVGLVIFSGAFAVLTIPLATMTAEHVCVKERYVFGWVFLQFALLYGASSAIKFGLLSGWSILPTVVAGLAGVFCLSWLTWLTIRAQRQLIKMEIFSLEKRKKQLIGEELYRYSPTEFMQLCEHIADAKKRLVEIK